MNFCNKHQMHFETEKQCRVCRDGLPKHWPHQPTAEQLTLTLLQNSTEGRKNDNDKPDLSLVPREALDEAAKAFMYGAKKYERYNYLGGMDWHRLVAASLRHITAFNEGEDLDPESGLSHLGHALATLSMLTVYYSRKLGKDDRYKGRAK